MSKIAVYPGSFDPITNGHIDIIERISKVFDEVIVLVSISAEKKSLCTVEEKVTLIKEALKNFTNIKVDSHQGLTVDYLKKMNARVIVRGLRAVVDFEYEMTMASINKKMNPDIETMLVFASPELYFVSSRGVKEVAINGGNLNDLVPQNVITFLDKKFKK